MGIEAPTPEQIESAEWVSKNAVGSDATVYFQAIEPEAEVVEEEYEFLGSPEPESEVYDFVAPVAEGEDVDLTVSDE